MKILKNVLFYGGGFFLLAGTIYHLCFLVPPIPGSLNYFLYQCFAVLLAVLLAGVLVGVCLMVEYREKFQLDDREGGHV